MDFMLNMLLNSRAKAVLDVLVDKTGKPRDEVYNDLADIHVELANSVIRKVVDKGYGTEDNITPTGADGNTATGLELLFTLAACSITGGVQQDDILDERTPEDEKVGDPGQIINKMIDDLNTPDAHPDC